MSAPEVIGYVASILIAVAMMMSNMLRLRVVALLGSMTMSLYGVLIGAWPIVIANIFISVVHAWYLRRLVFSPIHFELQSISEASHWYLARFLRFHGKDMAHSHPNTDVLAIDDRHGFFILRDLVSTGLFVYTKDGKDGQDLRIHLDYVTPEFRDLRSARFAYSEFDRRFPEGGPRRFLVEPPSAEMAAYYRRVGFTPIAGEPSLLEKAIHPKT